MRAQWATEPLGDLCDISIGRTPPRAERRYWAGGTLPWLSIADMAQGIDLRETRERITEAAVAECGGRLVSPGTLVMSFKLSVGKLGFARVPMYTNEAIAALPVKSTKNLEPRFLRRALERARLAEGADRAAKGLTLNSDKLARIPISYPRDPGEQARIADVLDKAEGVRRQRRAMMSLTDDLLRAIFLDMFGDPALNPKAWRTAPLSNLGRVTTGNTPSREVPEYFGSNIEWIKSDNINTPSHYLTRAAEGLSAQGRLVGRTAPAGSTLVTCIAGTPECIGNVALADREVAFNQQINAVTPYSGTDFRYLYAVLLVGKRLVQSASTNSMKGMVSKGKLEQVIVPAPPYDLQQRFGEAFERVLKLFRAHETAHAESEVLFDAVLNRAFGCGKMSLGA